MIFDKPTIIQVYQRFLEEIRIQILREPESFIIGGSTAELATYYFSNKHFEPIEIDAESGEFAEIKNEVRTISAHKRDEMYRNEGDLEFEYETIYITIPLKPNRHIMEILKMRPSTISVSWSLDEVKWETGAVKFQIDMKGYGFTKDAEQIARLIDQQKQYVHSYIAVVSAEISTGNDNLKNEINKLINERRSKLESDKTKYDSLLKQINIQIKRKDDEASPCIV